MYSLVFAWSPLSISSFKHTLGGVSVALADCGAAGLCRSEVGGIDL